MTSLRSDLEEWRPVVGYEGLYEVSDHGNVRSPRQLMKLYRDVHTYPRLKVNLRKDKRQHLHLVHRLVATAFISTEPPGKPYVLHGDGDATNNRVDNLRWGTHSDNMRDAVKHGTHKNTSKDVCPRGHKLVEPNLVAWRVKIKYRDCLSCNRTASFIRKARVSGRHVPDFQEYSDACYLRIMASA